MKRKGPAEKENKTDLDLMEAQSEKAFGTASQPSDEEQDWAERWGRRLGLILGYGLAVFLLWYLLRLYRVL
jgi:hypothetical protein